MLKKYLFLLSAVTLLAGNSFAQQPCGTDEMHKKLVALHPEILVREAEFNRQIAEGMKHLDMRKFAKTTTDSNEAGNKDFWYDIPIVVHIVHDYGSEYLSDDAIFNDLIDWNKVYAKQNYDTSGVIAPFIKYIGNPHIRLHLANVDPLGNPTKGITRDRSYLTYNGGEQAKINDWPNTSYVNIWFINVMGHNNQEAAAYAFYPSAGASAPYADGIIGLYNYAANDYTGSNAVSKTINHEMGHVFNLIHVWGDNNSPGSGVCGDDEVDDTPPTQGHNPSGCDLTSPTSPIYDTFCATGYTKTYPVTHYDSVFSSGHVFDSVMATTVDSIADYPDTTNSQNIMDYTYCSRMFTIGQVERMHAALNSDVAGRNILWSVNNLTRTGALLPRQDLAPIPAYSSRNGNAVQYFTSPGTKLRLSNESWNDTITAVNWTFSNGGAPATTLTSVLESFTNPGWVNITMSVTGNGVNATPIDSTFTQAIFVSDSIGTSGNGYMQTFDPSGDMAKWPTFNYYNNEFKWQTANVGYLDNNCMMYTGFDTRLNPLFGIYPPTGAPVGDFDDMFSVPMDLTSFAGGACNLDFMTSSASRTSNSLDINDTLEIDYSVDRSATWHVLKYMVKSDLYNKGTYSSAYAPLYYGDWAPRTIAIPTAVQTAYTIFRFRFKPGVDHTYGYSSGNNFYLDNIRFSAFTADVSNVNMQNVDVAVVPNPTSDNAYVIVKDANNISADIMVTDVTGKVVYKTTQQLTSNEAHIEIPHTAISVKGMYLVQVITGSKTSTQKLVVY